jgi:chromosomal replication initiator protein
MRLHAEHKARQARFSAAATKHKMAPFEITVPRNVPEPVLPPISDEQIKEAQEILQKKGLLNQVDIIQRVVLAKFPQVTLADLKSNRRTAKVVLPRQIGMYLCKELTNKSYPDIGRRFGGRDHSTVIHSVRKITEMVRDNEVFAQFINRMRDMI